MKLWVIKAAVKAAFRAFMLELRMPLTRIHSSWWDGYDHKHFCYAARLLEAGDFSLVCRHRNEIDFDAEWCDACDACPYMGEVDFITDESGQKCVKFWLPK